MIHRIDPAERPTTFQELGLGKRMLKSLDTVGYESPTPIQAELIPRAVSGRDCIGQAHTGTGKTAAFVIPILERIDHTSRDLQALVLSPTRELTEQVANEARRLAVNHECNPALLVGGKPIRSQLSALQKGPNIAIGTPGRVIDLIRRQALDLSKLKIVVLDEADRMLDIGFRPDIERILRSCPKERQTLLLSATLPPPVERLARRYMIDPEMFDLSQENVAADAVKQYYCTVEQHKKFGLLVRLLVQERPQQAIVFCRTKRGADRIFRRLEPRLPGVAAIHGDLQQRVRDRVMKEFRAGKTRLLIATDVVGRGIDVSGVSHIINYDVPEDCDDYVHRIGRTGRISSDRTGRAFTFVTPREGNELTRIEMRVNMLLDQYQIDGFKAFEDRGPRPHVNDEIHEAPEREEFFVV